MYTEKQITELKKTATWLRMKSLEIIYKRGAGHPGGCLSAAEIIASLYFSKLRVDTSNPSWEKRDRFILSKGHASAILYAALALRGFFDLNELDRWGELSCHLQGHPDRNKTPGVDMTTGTLGHGLNVASGMLLAARLKNLDFRTYVLMGDGEIQGGIIWEGAMTAAKFKLDKLTAILDYNGVQLDGSVDEIMPLEPVADKWRSFNFKVITVDGHDIVQLLEAYDEAENADRRPTIIIARTVKGKGVSFMENQSKWHGVAPSKEQYEAAIAELKKKGKENAGC
ncbi:MAG: Transketolase 2 [Actinobacteria bacterium ADurb.Bin346]|nr:MAG: Transketolase 2 [Actinobacteria bacterium ADurb.Bin346]